MYDQYGGRRVRNLQIKTRKTDQKKWNKAKTNVEKQGKFRMGEMPERQTACKVNKFSQSINYSGQCCVFVCVLTQRIQRHKQTHIQTLLTSTRAKIKGTRWTWDCSGPKIAFFCNVIMSSSLEFLKFSRDFNLFISILMKILPIPQFGGLLIFDYLYH